MNGRMGSRRGVILLLGLVFLSQPPALGQALDEALGRYQRGEADKAEDLLLSLSAEERNSPEALLLLGRTEPRGAQSRGYLGDALGGQGDAATSAEAQLLICKYEFCRGMQVAASELAEDFERMFPTGERVPEALWISGSSFLAAQRPDSALVRFGRILGRFPGSSWAAWAELGMGDCFVLNQEYRQAVLAYNRVLEDYRSSEAFPFALSGLLECYYEWEDPEKALLYRNLLTEKFPQCLESEEVPVRTARPSESVEPGRAEKLVGVKYTIQLGVFGSGENALGVKRRFEKQGYSVNIETKLIGGKQYSVVQLGSFDSYEEATDLRKKLEAQTGESYRVVIR